MRKANVLRAGFGLAIVIGLLFGEAGSSMNQRATEVDAAGWLLVASATDEDAPIEVDAGSKADARDHDGCPTRARHRR